MLTLCSFNYTLTSRAENAIWFLLEKVTRVANPREIPVKYGIVPYLATKSQKDNCTWFQMNIFFLKFLTASQSFHVYENIVSFYLEKKQCF